MLSLRTKFKIYYLVILTVVLLAFGFSIYAYLSRTLLTTIDESLDHQIRKIERQMAAGAGAEIGGNEASEDEPLQIAPHFLQFVDAEGRVIDQPLEPSSKQLPVNHAWLGSLEAGRTYFESTHLSTGEPLRVATRRAVVPDSDRLSGHASDVAESRATGQTTYFIRLGQSMKSVALARRRLLVLLLLALPIALFAGSYGGWVLVNQALRPVDRIRRAAERIGAGDLTERVPVPSQRGETSDEIGRLAVTFNQMIARLQAAFERQKQFTSDASHELRTPLAVMRGDIEIALRRERPVAEYQRVLTSNLEEIIRLSRLVEDLLMLARADASRIELRCEPVDLDQLCHKMVEYIAPLAEQRNQTLRYESDHQPATINADAQRIKQLLLNLLDNAIKYTDEGGAITLALRATKQDVTLTVSDTGRGIPPEDVPHIFERFFRRSAKTADRSATGFGLGLSIVRWIVEAHGGKIDVASQLGKGTTFTVTFPALQA